ncbi:MAG: hypothetical protein K5790_10195 [Nitrosopumilus sp.]|uniref:hypothetical protein n=1 Tax=Nitrosopumilus sp. TaxID=2024843 RepID=UPI00247EDFF3|nr:hypothetical protein [Nitrosopumilus sp.]MCV0393639.1 hypothetical protein [Nitrosopumilus sp.]
MDILNAVLFLVVLGIIFAGVGMLVGDGFKDITLESLGQAIAQTGDDPVAGFILVMVSLGFFVIIGALVFLFGKYVRVGIGKIFGLAEPEGDIDTDKKAYIVTFLFTGIITFIFIVAFASFLQGVNPDVNITDLGTLTNAISQESPQFWIVFILGLIGLGAIVGYMGRKINSIREGVPDSIAKI